MVIWKYVIKPKTRLKMPSGATILSVAAQGEQVCLWAAVDPESKDHHLHKFVGVPTGDSVPDDGTYLGTVFLAGGSLVFHIYEIKTS